MLKFSDTVPDQIRFRLQSVNESNLDFVLKELYQFAEYGVEGSVLLLQTCLAYLNHHRSDLNVHLEAVLVSVFKHIMTKPNFCTTFCLSLSSEMIKEDFLDFLTKALHLTVNEKISIGLALSDSESLETRNCGKNFVVAMVEEVFTSAASSRPVEQVQSILMFLHKSEDLSKHVDSFMQILSLVQLKDDPSNILAPFLPDEMRETQTFRNLDRLFDGEDSDFDALLAEMQNEISMGDIMKELGYGCTVTESQCREILSLFSPLTDVTVSRLLGTIVRSHVNLEDNQSTASTFCMALGGSSWLDTPSPSSWNIDILVDSIKQIAPDINWISVFEYLDHEGFILPNEDAFLFLISIYGRACQDPFPLRAICGSIWKNTEGQLSFLKYAVLAPPEVFTFAHSTSQLAYVDAVHGHKLQVGHANHAWLCLDLLNVLCQLAERGHASLVRIMLEYPLKYCPEILLLGMSHINTAYNLLRTEVSSNVFPLVMKSASGIGMILYLWHVNPLLVLRGFVDAVALHPDITIRILDISDELKILPQVLEMIPSSVGIRVAALASRKELIDLENWLNSSLSMYNFSFFEECLEFLKQIEFGDSSAKGSDHYEGLLSLYMESTSTFFKVLMGQDGVIVSQQQIEELERLRITLTRSNTRLQNGGGTEFSTSEEFTEDIDQEANTYFQQMFSGQLTVEAIVQMLSRFKESSIKREKSIYDCIIGNLFEEYKFFPKYPERQLKIAAVLFGSVIKDQLVVHIMLGIALRCVLDALRKPADSKMFVFGTKALEQFVDRLIEWPQYCNHILQISHLRATHPDIVTFIERTLARISSSHVESEPGTEHGVQPGAAQSSIGNVEVSNANSGLASQLSSPLQLQLKQETSVDERHKALMSSSSVDPQSVAGKTPSVALSEASNIQKNSVSSVAPIISSQGFARPARVATSARFGSALNIETLIAAAEKRDTSIEAPPSDVQDKISFLINNISSGNVEAKSKEFIEILKEHHYLWFAQYMVMKRASIEPNFHDVYLKFLDKVNSKALNKEVVQATYENCKVLLGSDLIKSSSEERSLLKNLGSWLGKLTIGRNQVLRAREIDPKSLIIEAYEKGKMIAVIPFTSKILEPCQSSLAYRPPNPWTMGILGLLAEIYLMPNLKMNLKFDIEVLFKNLGVDLKDISPTFLLKDRLREVEGNPDFSNKDAGAPQSQMVADVKSGVMPPINQVEMPLKVVTASDSSGPTHLLSQYAPPLHLSSGTLMEHEKLAALSLSDQLPSAQGLLQAAQSQSSFSMSQIPSPILNIGTHVVINQKLSTLGLHMHFQRVVPHAMERAIKEIVSNIVQRSVTIATQTTKELVLKDYALESDETRIYNAAHLMVASLAGSLAHVTCKEPLRASISSQLRTTIQGLNISSELLEQAVQLVTNDNLDLGCAVIEQAATDEAIQTIDGEIAQQLSLRRKHREGVTPAFFDASVFAQGSIGVLPEALRPKPGHLSLSQQRVYEDFVRLPWQNHSSQSSLPSSPASSVSVPSSNYEMVSGQLPGFALASVSANICIDPVSRQQDVLSDGLESTPAPYFSGSSTHAGAIDGIVNQHTAEKIPGTGSLSLSASASELSTMGIDVNGTVKEASSQQLPSPAAAERLGSSVPEPLLQPRDALDKYQIVAQKLEDLMASDIRDADAQRLIAEVPEIILRCRSRDEAALAVAQKVFKGLYENASNSFHITAHLAILAAIRDVCKLVVKELTSWVIYSDEERKFNKDITVGLIRSELLNLAEYNVHMAKLIDGGRNKAATEFSISLLQTLVTEEYSVISEVHNLVEALSKLSMKPGSPESLQQMIEILRNPGANVPVLGSTTIGKEDKVKQLKDKKAPGPITPGRDDYGNIDFVEPDPAGFQEQVCSMFTDWYKICESPAANEIGQSNFILKLHQNGFLKGDEMTDRLIRGLMEFAVGHCLSSESISTATVQSPQPAQNLSFLAIDPYSKLLFSILKYGSEQGSSKLLLLQRILGVTVKYILKDADDKKASFNPRPYFRLIINWLLDLNSLDSALDSTNFPILMAFANAFHLLQPLKVPGFSFAWLELVSHRSFMPKILTGNSQKGWPLFQKLLVDLFQFMEPYLRNAELGVPVHFLYKGTLRVLLVLLHDFPEFLCDYHFTFCDVIPPTCIQMRNIILSAFPRNMRLPDPSTPNLKIDLLAEISQSPRILSDVEAALKAKQIKTDVDEYLKAPRQQGPSSFLTELKQRLLLPASEIAASGTRYDVPLINSLVLYVGMQAIQQLQPTRTGQAVNSQVSLAGFLISAALEIFQTLIVDLDTEGRYLFLNAVANQLRYPNTHTHYFSFVLLYLFAESNQEIIQEQITRVLFERLIVNRPHPWGLLITFIELIKNPRYNFWNRSFIRCAPEIEKLFESVARSCGGPKPVDDSVSAWISDNTH